MVPAISIYEVFKRVLQQRDESSALRAMAALQQGTVVDLDLTTAMNTAALSLELGLPMAGSIMLATARAYEATLWSQDADFAGMLNVQYIEQK